MCEVSTKRVTDETLISVIFSDRGAGRSSEVESSLMVRWVVGSILHGVGPQCSTTGVTKAVVCVILSVGC